MDTGATHTGWPVDVTATFPQFESRVHEDRGALAVVNGIVYVPYSGYFGDCGGYHGSVVGVHIDNPSMVADMADGGDRRWYLGTLRVLPAMALTCL